MRRLKIAITTFICLIMMLTTIPIQVFADGVGDNGNGGGGSGTGSGNSAYTWDDQQSGFRIAIVDKDFKQVSTTVDFLFRNPSSNGLGWGPSDRNLYTNSRAKSQSSDKTGWTTVQLQSLLDNQVVGTIPKFPVNYVPNGGGGYTTQATGIDFREWFLSGKNGLDNIDAYDPPPPPPPVSVGYGTTKPSKKPTGTSGSTSTPTDMSRKNELGLYYDSSYRNYTRSIAASWVIDQGYFDHAWDIIYDEADTIEAKIIWRERREDKSYEKIMEEELGYEYSYCAAVSKSYAEAVYMYCAIIDSVAGSDWEATGNLKYAKNIDTDNSNGDYAKTNLTGNDKLSLENIPLAYTADAYADEILTYKDPNTSKYVFQFTAAAIAGMADSTGVNTSKNPLDVMKENNYYVIVEPIFWFRPAAWSGSGPGNPMAPNYVYGTESNLIQYYTDNGISSGGAYNTLTSSLGWSCFYTGKSWTGSGARPIIGVSTPNDKPSIAQLQGYLNTNVGFGMHIYTTAPKAPDDQTVTGDPTWKTQGAAPDPTAKKVTAGYTKEYNIVKYYEDVYPDGTKEYIGPFYRGQNPPKIEVKDEFYHKVNRWFVTAKDFTTEPPEKTFADAEKAYTATKTGTAKQVVFVDQAKGTEKTLFVLLERKIDPSKVDGPLVLGESAISKAVTTADVSVPTWGPKNFTFSYADMSGSDTHYCGAWNCSGHSCTARFGDNAFSYIIENSATLDPLIEANGAGGAFAFKILNNTKSGTAVLGGGSNTVSNVEYQTTFWRGNDIPTIASYKESSSVAVKSLLKRYGKEPAGDRGVNGPYSINFDAKFTVAAASDLQTHSVHSYSGSTWNTSAHVVDSTKEVTGDVTVNVYRGSNKKSAGNDTVASQVLTSTPFGATTSLHSAGYMVQSISPIYFYPYIRMTYMTTGSAAKTDVNILSQFYSELLPNDFGEAAWYNSNENESLAMSSVQWSLHAKAVNGGQSWNGRNQVLPGGALFQLGTSNPSPTKVAVVTWQTLLENSVRNTLYGEPPLNDYTLAKANVEHSKFVDDVKSTLEDLRVVQWVNKDVTATNAWTNNGQSIKITDAGQSLGVLGLDSNKTSDEAKYRLGKDKQGDAANQGDLDIIATNNSADTFFKVFADTSGNIYLAKSVGDMAALANINGTNTVASGVVTVDKVMTKKDTVGVLAGEAKQLNDRTLAITNVVKTLERNKGDDLSASWAVADGKWYNEAFDGIIVVRKASILDVGFSTPGIRTAVLDPKLMPKNEGVSDLFSKAFMSQFRLDSKSETAKAQSKAAHFVGTFEGKDIMLPEMESMYQSKKFYIPNVSVSDLN